MPNSLKSRLKKLKYQGLLSEKDLSRIYTDNDVIEELEAIKADLDKILDDEWGLVLAIEVVENRIVELKGDKK